MRGSGTIIGHVIIQATAFKERSLFSISKLRNFIAGTKRLISPALVAKRVSIFVGSCESHHAWSLGSDLNLSFTSKLKINLEERKRCCMFASADFDLTPDQVVNMVQMEGVSKDPLDMVIPVFLLSPSPIIIIVMVESVAGKSNYNRFLGLC